MGIYDAGAQAPPPGDPAFSPVAGVALERYVELGVEMTRQGLDEAGQQAYVAARGIPPARWAEATAGWGARLASDGRVAMRYAYLYRQAMDAAGITAPDVPLERYAEMLGAIQSGTPVDQVCARFGITMQEFSLVSEHWGLAIAGDVGLAMRFGQLLQQHLRPPGTPGTPPGAPTIL